MKNDYVINEIAVILKKYNSVIKAVLFGSRARGDNTEKSDYDIAVFAPGITQAEKLSILNEIDDLNTLHKIDLVFMSEKNIVLNDNIKKDGKVIMDKLEIKLNNFRNALERLKESITEEEKSNSTVVRDGVIQRFEFTTELSWKTAREYLLSLHVMDINSPKTVLKEAYNNNLIDNEEAWLQILTDRNSTSHIYDEDFAKEIFQRINAEMRLDVFAVHNPGNG